MFFQKPKVSLFIYYLYNYYFKGYQKCSKIGRCENFTCFLLKISCFLMEKLVFLKVFSFLFQIFHTYFK